MVSVSFGIGRKLRPIISFGPKPKRWFRSYTSVWQLQKKSINSILWFSIKVTIHSIFKFFDHVKFRNHFIFVTYLIIWLRKSAKNFEKTSTSEVSKSSFGLWSTKSIKTQQLRLHKKTSLSACILSWSKSWIYLLTYILNKWFCMKTEGADLNIDRKQVYGC